MIDVDATLVTAHSEKEHAAANFKGGFGVDPLGAWFDNTGEMLAVMLRPGNARNAWTMPAARSPRDGCGSPISRRHRRNSVLVPCRT